MKPAKNESGGKSDRDGAGGLHVGQALLLGTNLAIGMAVFTFGGYWIGSICGGGVFWTLGGMLLGFAFSVYEVWKVVSALNKELNEGESSDSAGTAAGDRR